MQSKLTPTATGYNSLP